MNFRVGGNDMSNLFNREFWLLWCQQEYQHKHIAAAIILLLFIQNYLLPVTEV